jgi:AhpD family alkylhydroperoxidase
MANSPALLKGYMGLSSALSAGVLTPAVRERLALAAAEYNRCSYCLSGHTMFASRVAKIDDDEIARARHADSADLSVAPQVEPGAVRPIN